MKIKSVATLCKKRKNVTLFQGKTQWVGDGSCMYPLYALPEMELSNIMAMFDIPEDKVSEYSKKVMEVPSEICIEDSYENEDEIEQIGTCISFRGNAYEVIPTSNGAKLINAKYLSPFSDMDDCKLYERKSKTGQIYIAVKQGFILYGIICPEEITEYLQKDVDRMAMACNKAVMLKKQKESAKNRDEYIQKKFVNPEVDYDEN